MQETIISQQIKIVYELVEQPYEWEQNPFNGENFVCLLVVNDKDINNETQDYISSKLVDYGCKYAVCMGYKCSTWDDSIDLAYLEMHDYEPNDEDFVMTSWHESGTIEDTVFFFIKCTSFDNHSFENYLVLFLGEDEVKKSSIVSEISNVL